jgi:CBS domain-containing protein
MVELYVDQVMSRPVATTSATAPIHDAAEEMIRNDVGAIVVVDDGRFEGLLTATDFVLLARKRTAPTETTVAELMRTDVVTTERHKPVRDVVDSMLEHLIHHVPVVDGEEVVGMVTTLDLTAHLGQSLEP